MQNPYLNPQPDLSFHADKIQSKQYEELVINEKKIFVCLIPGCEKRFKFQSEMKRHLTNHSNQRPFVCAFPDCGKAFKRPDALSNHFRIHSKKSLFECPFPECNSQFTTNSSLKYHLLKHKNDRTENCSNQLEEKTFQEARQNTVDESDFLNQRNLDSENTSLFGGILKTHLDQNKNNIETYPTNLAQDKYDQTLSGFWEINSDQGNRNNMNNTVKAFSQSSEYDISQDKNNAALSTQKLLKNNAEETLKNMMNMMINENNHLKKNIGFPI